MNAPETIVPVTKSLWNSSISYITRSASASEQRHYCYKIAVSLDNTVNCWMHQTPHIGIRGFVVNQRKTHQCASPQGPILNNLVEPESIWGQKIKTLLGDRDFVRFEDLLDPGTIEPVLPPLYADLPNNALTWHIERLLSAVTGTDPNESRVLDERIERVLVFLDDNPSVRVPRKAIEDLTFLSFERSRHLFAQEMGIPLSRYLLWQRLRKSLKDLVAGGKSISEITARHGFADQSHFNRRFKEIFGLIPSQFLLNCRLII